MTDQSLRSGAVFRQFLVLRSGAICKEKKNVSLWVHDKPDLLM